MEHWQQVKRIVEQILDCPQAEREALLDAACGSDDALRREVMGLIASEGEADRFFERTAPEAEISSIPEGPEGRLGPYRLRRKIGHGGMGAVYLAEREDDAFQRTVAVKLLRPGMESDELVARFRTERQILASIDHPNIAKLYDGGATEDGRPYLVMEYIDGIPIDAFCDAHDLTTADRLRLFIKVCASVHVAHQHLVVHRDLKPANILVTEDGEPKLLDFGIAKLIGAARSMPTMAGTRHDVRVMTPEYASPEQARGELVTTASDVYALGVLLFELLTGQLPYDLSGLDFVAMARAIEEREPVRPSDLRKKLRGDLDNIILKALHKETARRYSSVQQLSDDIERHLENRPVVARADTFSYLTGRFLARHRLAVGAAVVMVAALGAFTAVMVRARARAESEVAKTQAINLFLQSVLGSANVAGGGRRDVTVVEAIDLAIGRVDESFQEQPDLQAEVLYTVGRTLVGLGDYARAEPHFVRALAIRRELHGELHTDVATSRFGLGLLYFQRGDYEKARDELWLAVELQRAVLASAHPDLAHSLHLLGLVAAGLGERDEAESLYREALAIRRRSLGLDHPLVARALMDLAELKMAMDDPVAAEPLYREAVTILRSLSHPELSDSLDYLAHFLTEGGQYGEADRLLAEAEELHRLRGSRGSLARNRRLRAELERAQGRYEGASLLFEQALDMFRDYLGDAHPEVAEIRTRYAACLLDLEQVDEAHEQLTEARAIFREAFGENHRLTREAWERLLELGERGLARPVAKGH